MNNKVVTFERGADFYFDLSYKYIQKGRLKTALRYIEKAVSLKPHDSFLQFNYAGLLAEQGHIDRSTEVLLNIVKNIDPNYLECYFGLGCNYLQLQKIKKSSEYFSIYLEKDPGGEFAEEAEELPLLPQAHPPVVLHDLVILGTHCPYRLLLLARALLPLFSGLLDY